MSTYNLKPGDRVRVRVGDPDRGCQVGDKGTVFSGARPGAGSGWIYYVTMGSARPDATPVGFRADEIELDV
jgi:hypothetical protein